MITNLKRLAGINEGRSAEGDAVLLANSLLRSLKRYRQLSEHKIPHNLIADCVALKRQLTEASVGPEIYRTMELAGIFEEEDEKEEKDEEDSNTGNTSDYGYETDSSGNEKGSNSAVMTELAALHGDMMDCWSSLHKCVMDCTIDGSDVPSALNTTIDKLGRAIEQMEHIAGKV